MYTTASWISDMLATHSIEAVASNAYLYETLVGAALLTRLVRSVSAPASDAARRPEREPA